MDITKNLITMPRSRLFMGLTSTMDGIGGLLFPGATGVAGLVELDPNGWMFAVALIIFGLLMSFAAMMEEMGEQRRRCREIAACFLACTWMAVGFHSLEDGVPDTATLQAPLYVIFCAWSWFLEAKVHSMKVRKANAQ